MGWNLAHVPYPKWSSTPDVWSFFWYDALHMSRAGSWWIAGSVCAGLCVRNCLSGNPCPEVCVYSGVAADLAHNLRWSLPLLMSRSPSPARQRSCRAVRQPSTSIRDLFGLQALLGIPSTMRVRFGFSIYAGAKSHNPAVHFDHLPGSLCPGILSGENSGNPVILVP